MYFVYIVQCADETLYIGTTNDLEKRIIAHNSSKTGAKYTRTRRPIILRYSEELESKGAALSREAELKKLTRTQKLQLIDSHKPKSHANAALR